MKLIYVASPYRGNVEKNTEFAAMCCNYAIGEGVNVYCPHLFLPKFLDEYNPIERKVALELGKDMLKKCDELWVFGNEITSGMQEEIDFAKSRNIDVVYIGSIQQGEMEQILC